MKFKNEIANGFTLDLEKINIKVIQFFLKVFWNKDFPSDVYSYGEDGVVEIQMW